LLVSQRANSSLLPTKLSSPRFDVSVKDAMILAWWCLRHFIP
jgi:hypothetical protein